uniref:Uncharacterized protein n=1 Tax=Anguilla anguilla TaxID=7936 RepID=A0A0E9QWW0_ANGAN
MTIKKLKTIFLIRKYNQMFQILVPLTRS